MPEVEIRVPLDDARVEDLKKRIADDGVILRDQGQQRDVYYKEAGFRSKVQEAGSYAVRIRYADKGASLTMKRLTYEDGVWDEVETGVQDGHAVEEIVKALGAEYAVTVTKERLKGMSGDIEVILDQVLELGSFLELAIVTDDDPLPARERLLHYLRSLGLDPNDVDLRGYPTILLEQEGVRFSAK